MFGKHHPLAVNSSRSAVQEKQKVGRAVCWTEQDNSVVDADTVCLFKARLDKFWMHEDVLYDFTADLTGIGDRSVRESS